MQGISAGLKANGVTLDVWDLVALNAFPANGNTTRKSTTASTPSKVQEAALPEHCSAFVATGSYTRDGKVIIAHNDWTTYVEGSRWTIIFDIVAEERTAHSHGRLPLARYTARMTSGSNSAGIMITETTISRFSGYDPNGIPEFIRARKAMQYAASIDDFARIMKEGNNGGYANNWLVADRKDTTGNRQPRTGPQERYAVAQNRWLFCRIKFSS